jgi:hypothetical protein
MSHSVTVNEFVHGMDNQSHLKSSMMNAGACLSSNANLSWSMPFTESPSGGGPLPASICNIQKEG